LNSHQVIGPLSLSGEIINGEFFKYFIDNTEDDIISSNIASNIDELWKTLVDGGELEKKETLVCPNGQTKRDTIKVEECHWERFWILISAIAEVPILLIGPPGAGKSHLAQWSHALLPERNHETKSQIEQIWRLANLDNIPQVPLISPHAKSKLSEFVGVKRNKQDQPGHFSLAHGGMLILDEFAEMNRDCREILRNVLDSKQIIKNTIFIQKRPHQLSQSIH